MPECSECGMTYVHHYSCSKFDTRICDNCGMRFGHHDEEGCCPNLIPIGTQIQFLKKLDSPATGDHPAFLYAEKGELGEVVGYGTIEGYWVKIGIWPKFGASLGEEFKVLR